MSNLILLIILFFNSCLVISRKARTLPQPVEVSEKDADMWCKYQPNGYDCKETGRYTENYYFDTKLEDCKLFIFGSCNQERNKFKTLKDCRDNCLEPGTRSIFGKISAQTYCKFQPDFGLCNGYYPKFYFDISTKTCKGFSYSGCGGNLNRFSSAQLCSTICGKLIEDVSKELT